LQFVHNQESLALQIEAIESKQAHPAKNAGHATAKAIPHSAPAKGIPGGPHPHSTVSGPPGPEDTPASTAAGSVPAQRPVGPEREWAHEMHKVAQQVGTEASL
jgi:hypothetical protein